MRLEALLPFAPSLSDAAPKLQHLLRPPREFLAWWTSELRACVPSRLRGILEEVRSRRASAGAT